MPKLFRPLKIEIGIETLGSNTLVKAKSWGGGLNEQGALNPLIGGPGPPPLTPPMASHNYNLRRRAYSI